MAGIAEKVYGDALFETAKKNECIEQVFKELQLVKKAFKENAGMREILRSPLTSPEEKEQTLSSVFENRISSIVFNTLKVLINKKRLESLFGIISYYYTLYDEFVGTLLMTIYSPRVVSSEQVERIKSKLEYLTHKKIEMRVKTDPELIGGICVEYNGRRIDASIKARLDNMKKQIQAQYIR